MEFFAYFFDKVVIWWVERDLEWSKSHFKDCFIAIKGGAIFIQKRNRKHERVIVPTC